MCAAAEQHVDDPVIIEKILSDPYTRDAYASLPFAKRPINTLIGRLVHQSTSKSELSLVLNYPGSAHAEIAATLLLEKHALTQEELDWVLHAAKHISTALVTRCLELTAQIYPHHLKGVTTRGETTDGLQPKTDQLLQQLLKS